MLKHSPSIIAALAITIALSPVLRANDNLLAARADYNQTLSAIEKKYSGNDQDGPARYRKSVEALGRSFQATGNLDGLIAARAELKRFEGDSTIPEDAVVEEPLELKKLQEEHQKSKGDQSLAKSEAVVALLGRYLDYLEREMKALTIAGDVDGALVVRAEIKRVKASAPVTAAQFDIDVRQSKKPDEKEPLGVAKEAPKMEKPTAPQGYVIHPPGKRPPRVAKQTFKRMTLKQTSNTPMSKRWATASASCCLASSGTQKNSAIRVQVRSAKSSVVLKDQTVNIQFFTRPAKVKGKVEPTRVRSDYIKLPELTSGGVYIDCPDVKTRISRSTSRYSRVRRTSGSEFYAILINVYNADGTSCYQGASDSGLEGFASASAALSEERKAQEKVALAKAAYVEALAAYRANRSDATLKAEYTKALTAYRAARAKK
jgi:hypothetical protein